MKFKIEISEEDTLKAVKEMLERQGFEVSNLVLNTDMGYRGYGTSEQRVPVFRNISADVTSKPAESGRASSLASQIEQVESQGQYEGR